MGGMNGIHADGIKLPLAIIHSGAAYFFLILNVLVAISPAALPASGEISTAASDTTENALQAGFRNPPESAKPGCYWYWLNDNLSKAGITRDLEAMARVGIGEAFIGNIFLDDLPAGKVKVLSDSWWEHVQHAIREAARVGVKIGMFNSPGWSQSGGPWVKPEQAMRYLVSAETRVTGPAQIEKKLLKPQETFQDVALLAFPVLPTDVAPNVMHPPQVTCTPSLEDVAQLVDNNQETSLTVPAGVGQSGEPLVIELDWDVPYTARSISIVPGATNWAAHCELQVADGDGQFHMVRSFPFDRSNMDISVGPLPRGPVTATFEPTTSQRFRLLLTDIQGQAALAEVRLSTAPLLESFIEKQLGKMHPTPLPLGDAYRWPAQPEIDSPNLVVAPEQVLNLTDLLDADGTLRWEVPPGEWVILRTGMTTTGKENGPASPEGTGLEIDKMSRPAAQAHFDAYIGRILKQMPADDRRAFKTVVADSYEAGSQNWTDGFAKIFRDTYGYDPVPWLPVLTGRLIGNADQSERFLWDLRRLVADRIATEYVGGLRDLCHEQGLQLWLENYGHWGFTAEFLQYGGQSDQIAGEFWVTGDLGSIECRAASSCANTYGKPRVSAEAFTGGPPFQTSPADMKARGDWAFCEGINHFVLHVYIHQPWEDRQPGVNAWFGTEFNRHNTWFDAQVAWIEYLQRSCFLLQQGTRVTDVAYFIGEDTPKMTGLQQPPLPPGYDFDYINAEVLQQKLRVHEGLITLPHGVAYRVLVLPEWPTMRPGALRSVRDLVKAGATVLGPPPSRSPSMSDYPHCDQVVQELAAEIWGDADTTQAGERRLGKGKVVWRKSLEEVLDGMRIAPDFASEVPLRYTHRSVEDSHIYFVTNPQPQEVLTTASFRVGEMAPEFWWPQTGRCESPAIYDLAENLVRVPLRLGPHGSVFVVFRDKVDPANRIVSVERNGKKFLATAQDKLQDTEGMQFTINHRGNMEAAGGRPGEYHLKTADGNLLALKIESPPDPLHITGPWEVTFTSGWGAPERATFEHLEDWSQRLEDGIRHYSGKARYQKSFVLPASLESTHLQLDLGEVHDLATVRLNGLNLGRLWLAPWCLDVTESVRPGKNVLEIEVVNTWNNRLVGDAKLPSTKRLTFLTKESVATDSPLLPAGLIGPVKLRAIEHVEAESTRNKGQ